MKNGDIIDIAIPAEKIKECIFCGSGPFNYKAQGGAAWPCGCQLQFVHNMISGYQKTAKQVLVKTVCPFSIELLDFYKPVIVQQTPTNYCTCSIDILMRSGCKCRGI